MRTPCIAGNWKLHTNPADAGKLVRELRDVIGAPEGVEVLVFPPFLSVGAAVDAAQGSPVGVGTQDIYHEESGAFTGEVAPGMALAAGCSHTLIGHSERRTYFGETNGSVRMKVDACIKAGLKAIVCVGETLEQRENKTTFEVISDQVRTALEGLNAASLSDLMIAYEPVWAIGTGKTATPEQADEVHVFIRNLVDELHGKDAAGAMRILYGGSVKPDNVDGLMACEHIDGALVGGASLKADSFARIVQFSR